MKVNIKVLTIGLILLCCFIGTVSAADDVSTDLVSDTIVDDVTVIIDNQKEYTFPVLDSTLNYMFCKVLNEQHETIQRLKQNIDELLSVNVEEELLKENEYIKQTIKDMMENERTELGQSVLRQLYEAIQ